MNLDEIFYKLWEIYTQNNPTSKKVYDLFTNAGEKVLNDHIAFRTFNLPKINIDSIANVFIKNGYEYKQDYHFKDKKLYAKHYEHSVNSLMPKIFISELIIEEFSDEFQKILKNIYSEIDFDKFDKEEIIYAGRLWEKASYKIYERLRQESEYAAWLYYNGFVANHFTINVNELKIYDSLEKVNDFLNDGQFHQIATIGPESILKAQENTEYKNVLNNCDLNIADGIGIRFAFWRLGSNLKTRVAGADLILEMLNMAENKKISIFLACRRDGLSNFKETKTAILNKYPRLEIYGDDIDIEQYFIGEKLNQSQNLINI